MNFQKRFQLDGKIAVITGGGGLLGAMHAEIIAEAGGIPILIDINKSAADTVANSIKNNYSIDAMGFYADITKKSAIESLRDKIIAKFGTVNILINNAANDAKITDNLGDGWSRLENFPIDIWNADLAVGLTGAFICSQVFGTEMAKRGQGTIINISSDLGIIGPDQRLYEVEGTPPDKQPVKPVTYSVTKSGLLGLTRYLATYWAKDGVRVNTLCPGGVDTGQPAKFKNKLFERIPMGRMAQKDEYQGAILFLTSDASSYMTGASLTIDGGRTSW